MEPSQLDMKKSLLTEEIINKGFNGADFLQFCINKRENGDDMNNWTLEELKSCVSDFQNEILNANKPEQKPISTSLGSFLLQNSQNNNINNNYINNNNINNNYINNNNMNNNNYVNNYMNNYMNTNIPVTTQINQNIQNINFNDVPKQYRQEINCKILEKTELTYKHIIITIQNPLYSDRSILSTSFTTYEIVTKIFENENSKNCNKWIVRRRYSDFDWLRNVLCKIFPRSFVPPLPGKKTGNRRFETDFIEKRMKFLQKFLDNIILNEFFKSSDALIAFLQYDDRNKFELKMKELNNYNPSNFVDDMKTLTGKLKVIDDDENEKYFTNIKNYFKLEIIIYSRLNYYLKNFYLAINNACKNLDDIQKIFDTLYTLNKKVLMRDETTKTFEELSIFFKNWGRILSNENEIIHDKIKDFFKYQKMQDIAYTELISKRDIIKEQYMAEKKKVDEKKMKLYPYMDINKWEITEDFNQIDMNRLFNDRFYAFEKMCTRETQALEGIHRQLGYANHMNFAELKKIIRRNDKIFVSNTKDFANEFYLSLNDAITLWSTLNTYI